MKGLVVVEPWRFVWAEGSGGSLETVASRAYEFPAVGGDAAASSDLPGSPGSPLGSLGGSDVEG